jgi:hypothetical protein
MDRIGQTAIMLILGLVSGMAMAQEDVEFTQRVITANDITIAKECSLAAVVAVQLLTDNPNSESRRQQALAEMFRSGQLPRNELVVHTKALSAIETLVLLRKQPFDPIADRNAYATIAASICSRGIDIR